MAGRSQHIQNVIELKPFNMSSIPPGKKIAAIGNTGSGKSVVVKDYLYHHQSSFPIGTIISPTEELNETFKNHVPSILIHNEYSNEIIAKIVQRQIEITRKINTEPVKYANVNPYAFCIMDDCLADVHLWKTDRNIRWIFENGRHAKLTFIITLQYVLGLPPHLRCNIDYIFLCRTAKLNEQKKLYEYFAGMFDSFAQFREVFIQCTKNYGCMVINNNALQSDSIQDQVFHYRVNLKNKPDFDTFKLCLPLFWKDNTKCIKIKRNNSEIQQKQLASVANKDKGPRGAYNHFVIDE